MAHAGRLRTALQRRTIAALLLLAAAALLAACGGDSQPEPARSRDRHTRRDRAGLAHGDRGADGDTVARHTHAHADAHADAARPGVRGR